MPGVLLCCSVCQIHRRSPLPRLCRWVLSHLKGHWVGSYSVVPCIKHLMGQPLYSSAADAGAWGGREAMVMAPSPIRDSAVSPCFHGCLAFLHRYFTPQSPPSGSLSLSLQRQQQPSPWNCSTIPKLQLPAAVHSREPMSLSGVSMAAARTV